MVWTSQQDTRQLRKGSHVDALSCQTNCTMCQCKSLLHTGLAGDRCDSYNKRNQHGYFRAVDQWIWCSSLDWLPPIVKCSWRIKQPSTATNKSSRKAAHLAWALKREALFWESQNHCELYDPQIDLPNISCHLAFGKTAEKKMIIYIMIYDIYKWLYILFLCSGKNVFSQIAHFTQESGAEAPLPVRKVILWRGLLIELHWEASLVRD